MSRIKCLDLARGFVVFMIAPVHTMLMFSQPELRETLVGKLFAFISEWHGAQIFMVIMGISYTLSKKQSIEIVCKKAAVLMALGYLLNFLKFVVPHFFGWLPPALLQELQVDTGEHGYLQLLGIGDILQFASFALIYLFFVSKFKGTSIWILLIAALYCFCAPVFWDSHSENPFVNYLLILAGGQPPQVFFPILPWIVYPLLGLYIGRILEKDEHWLSFDSFWLPGLMLLIGTAILKWILGQSTISSFYRTSPLDTLLHVGYLLIALSAWYWISRNVKTNILFRLFSYCSAHITMIYFIQWILIFWMLPFVHYQNAGPFGSLGLIMLTSFVTLTISLYVDLLKSTQPAKSIVKNS